MEKNSITRRLFCRGLALTPFLPLTNIVGIIGCATVPVYRSNLVGGRITVKREELTRRVEKSKVFVMQISELQYPIIVVQKGSDNYRAFSVRCTHQGCHVRPKGNSLSCPCHGSTYDLEGNVIRGPAKAPLHSFDVIVTANGIDVIVDQNNN